MPKMKHKIKPGRLKMNHKILGSGFAKRDLGNGIGILQIGMDKLGSGFCKSGFTKLGYFWALGVWCLRNLQGNC